MSPSDWLWFAASILALFAILVGSVTAVRRISNLRQLTHIIFKPTSRALAVLTCVVCAILSGFGAFLLNFDWDGSAGGASAAAILGAAVAASLGWVYTTHHSRMLSLVSHTQDLLAQHRTSEIYEAHRRNVMRRFPYGSNISHDDARDIINQRKSQEQHWGPNPPLYYSIQQTLNFHEYVAAGIRHDRLDRSVVENYQRSIMVASTIKFHEVLKLFWQDRPTAYSGIRWIMLFWYDVDIKESIGAEKLRLADEKFRNRRLGHSRMNGSSSKT